MGSGNGFNLLWVILACLIIDVNGAAWADDEDVETVTSDSWEIEEWHFQTSLYTKHWDPDPEHDNSQSLIGVEALFRNGWIVGGAVFDNSFGQTSEYLFMGKQWDMFGSDYWYFKLTGGLLYGYKEPYDEKIPLNDLGVAPAFLPIIGFRYKRVFIETNILGIAAVTLTAGFAF
jgi:hypothetical protein